MSHFVHHEGKLTQVACLCAIMTATSLQPLTACACMHSRLLVVDMFADERVFCSWAGLDKSTDITDRELHMLLHDLPTKSRRPFTTFRKPYRTSVHWQHSFGLRVSIRGVM